jgi:hypothetical protein
VSLFQHGDLGFGLRVQTNDIAERVLRAGSIIGLLKAAALSTTV